MRTFFLFLLSPLALIASGLSYHVEFEGLEDGKTLNELKLASNLTSLKKRPPASINALRYRADSDIPLLMKVLHAHGYYQADVQVQIHELFRDVGVVVIIVPGPRYTIGSFEIHVTDPNCCAIDLEDIGIQLHKPANSEAILNAQMKVLQKLAECGYPLAAIKKTEAIVDGQSKQVLVSLEVDTGQKVTFGPTTILGTKHVKPRFIEQQLRYKQKETYDSRLIDSAQTRLIDTQLFSSVLITHEETPLSDGELPLKVEVRETKHRNINAGISYQTVFGPGVTFGWANRNVGGMGRTLSFQGELTHISQTGVATYIHPDFCRIDQKMIAVAEAAHEDIFPYSMRSYSLMDRFERKITERLSGSLGVKGDRLYITDSAQNGNFWLMTLPLYLRWSCANSLLNPTRGFTVEYTVTPAINMAESKEIYLTQQFIGSFYNPLDKKEKIVLAHKLTLGFLFSNGLGAVPLCNRFLGGTEEDLRGYRYKSVSPFVGGKPIGGRCAIYYTFETRFRLTNTIGLVPFFDIGSVYTTQHPTFHGKWYKSVGMGFRFFTVMGPFRVDLAFPLDRRKKVDNLFKVLVSIGQMF